MHDHDADEDVDRLVEALGLAAPDAHRRTRPPEASLGQWLERLVGAEGSDLLLVAGAPPTLMIDGRVVPLDGGPLDGDDIEQLVLPALQPHALKKYRAEGIVDASLRLADVGRFRINLHRERGRAAAAIRALPVRPPVLSTLHLPPQVAQLSHLPRGLVLVGGPTGSGKSTTLAALVNEINTHHPRHIVTIEDPVEFEHPHKKGIVEQVEIGVDAPDFPTALRAALRQAPDVILVGEMRDPETMQIAVSAAETGHLVLSSVHTSDVTSSIARIADAFPTERQNLVRQDLSLALSAVLVQMLLPKQGGGRVPAVELLMVDYGARQHIRRNALQHLHQEITISRKRGSLTFEDHLVELVVHGAIDVEDARARAVHRDEFDDSLRSAQQRKR